MAALVPAFASAERRGLDVSAWTAASCCELLLGRVFELSLECELGFVCLLGPEIVGVYLVGAGVAAFVVTGFAVFAVAGVVIPADGGGVA